MLDPQRERLALAMYISSFFCVDFICVGYPTQTRFQWNMGLTVLIYIYIYHISIKRQIIRLPNDIDNIKMVKRILLKIDYKFEEKKNLKFLAIYISLDNFVNH